jgi:hypothetical protein
MKVHKLLIALGGALLTAVAAVAAPSHPTFGSFVNAGDVPAGSALVLNITMNVVNDEDSGNVGYWALDSYNKHVQVWQVPDGTFYAVVRYIGKWTTFAGARSPGAGITEGADASGTMEGGYAATFNATGFTPASGNIGTINFGGTKADVLLGTYGAGQTGDSSITSWLDTYFTGVGSSFNYVAWGWTYKYKNKTWNNFDYGTTGDVVAGP